MPVRFTGVEAAPVVSDLELDAVAIAFQRHSGLLGHRVAIDVAESLLNNAVNS